MTKQPPAKPDEAFEPKKPVVPRLMVTDTTPEKLGPLLQEHPAGLLHHRDELAGWIGSFNRYSGAEKMASDSYGSRHMVDGPITSTA